MNIEQLTYVVEVAKTKSLAIAARTLNVSSSALSQAISRLESELNLKIFNRTRTGAVTTKEGDSIIEKAQNALKAIYEIKEEAHNQINNSNNLLSISVIPGLTGPIIDTYLSLRKEKPLLKIEVNEKGSMEIIKDIKRDVIDIGFIALNKANIDNVNELQFTPVLKGKILVFVSKQSPLAEKEIITADLLKNQMFVLYKDEYVQEFIHSFQKLYGPVDVFFKATNTDVIIKAVMELGAVTIGHDVSALYNPQFLSEKLISIDIEGISDATFTFGWIQKAEYKLSKEAKHFVEAVNKALIKH